MAHKIRYVQAFAQIFDSIESAQARKYDFWYERIKKRKKIVDDIVEAGMKILKMLSMKLISQKMAFFKSSCS